MPAHARVHTQIVTVHRSRCHPVLVEEHVLQLRCASGLQNKNTDSERHARPLMIYKCTCIRRSHYPRLRQGLKFWVYGPDVGSSERFKSQNLELGIKGSELIVHAFRTQSLGPAAVSKEKDILYKIRMTSCRVTGRPPPLAACISVSSKPMTKKGEHKNVILKIYCPTFTV